MEYKETEWYKSIKKYKYKMIFGAKADAYATFLYINNLDEDILCYIVSKREDNPLYLNNKQVKTFDEIDEKLKEESLVIVSQKYESNENMKRILLLEGFKHIISSPTQSNWKSNKKTDQYRLSILGEMTIIDANNQNSMYVANNNLLNMCIYAVTSHKNLHKGGRSYKSKYIKYIQAGATLSEKLLCELTDDVGENISELNPYFCELTAGYWIYKNDKVNDFVGLYHYSRGFSMTDEQIEYVIEKGIDVVLPFPIVYRHELATMLLSAWKKDWIDLFLDGINNVSPEYVKTTENFLMEKLFFNGNIVIARKEVFCLYYEWMFQVFRECEEIRKERNLELIPRIWGYYGECLTNIYFLHHLKEYKIFYSHIESLC